LYGIDRFLCSVGTVNSNKKEKGPSLVRCTQCVLSAEGLYYFVISHKISMK